MVAAVVAGPADAPATFKCDAWKHFGFPVSKYEKGEKDGQKTIFSHCRTSTKTLLQLFFAHIVAVRVTSLLKKRH